MWNDFFVVFFALFVALDIIGVVPMYLSMTRDLGYLERNKVVDTSMLVATIVAVIFIFVGQTTFKHLGINLYDFKMAGGLVLLLVSLADLVGGPEAVNRSSGSTGIVPLAVPLITGPGVLTTVILHVGTKGYLISIAALLLNYALAWIILRKCESVTRIIGKDGTVVISKIAALLLTAIAVAMMRSGVFEAISARAV